MSDRRTLVTGGGGFIGLHLVQQLLERGETVRVLELPDVPLPIDVEVVRGSVCDAYTVNKALKDIDRLYHLAANPNLWARDKNDFRQVNYEGTCTVLQEAAKHDLEVIVYTSTESILTGKGRHEVMVDSAVKRFIQECPALVPLKVSSGTGCI
ncbi:MAG: NAD-dependent epimerase/dehydratase family protein [Nitrosomonas sp.]|nr:NAD-dependent epimerase/dehydratase family protein [Nitrosomonas sp.]